MMGFLVKCFSSGCETVCKKLLNLVQVALTKIPRNEAKIYKETEFHSSEGHLFTVLRALPLPHWKVFDNFLTSF